MISGRISGTALTDTGVVMQKERTRGHADCDTFKFMVTAPATGTGRVWNDNGNGQDITDNVTNTNSVTVMDSDTVTNTGMATSKDTDQHNH